MREYDSNTSEEEVADAEQAPPSYDSRRTSAAAQALLPTVAAKALHAHAELVTQQQLDQRRQAVAQALAQRANDPRRLPLHMQRHRMARDERRVFDSDSDSDDDFAPAAPVVAVNPDGGDSTSVYAAYNAYFDEELESDSGIHSGRAAPHFAPQSGGDSSADEHDNENAAPVQARTGKRRRRADADDNDDDGTKTNVVTIFCIGRW